MARFIIYSPKFDENNGGAIALHLLCHEINKAGHKAHLFPTWDCQNPYQISDYEKFTTNPDWETPLAQENEISKSDGTIIIYPEITYGNPLHGKRIVRWFLHHPGFHSRRIGYNCGEYYIRFGPWIKPIDIIDSYMSGLILSIIHIPFDLYNRRNTIHERQGSAFCLRKGRGRKIIHDLSESILIDGKSHREIADIFKRVRFFISYDLNTAYSAFAAMCGCISIVAPKDGLSLEEWAPTPEDRHGIAYGVADIQRAKNTQHLVYDALKKKQDANSENVKSFLNEVREFFGHH